MEFVNDSNWDKCYKKAKNDFLNKYPNCCAELIELFWWAYSFYIWHNGGI